MSDQSRFGRRIQLGGAVAAATLLILGMAGCGGKVGADTASVPQGQSTQITSDDAASPASLDPSPLDSSPTPTPSKSAKPSPRPSPSRPKASPTVKPSPTKAPTSTTQCVKPAHGTFTVASGGSSIAGSSGHLYRYQVQVQNGIGVAPASFASAVDATLRNKLGWTDSGTRRFQRVSSGACDFVVELATASVSQQICAYYGLSTEGKVSCRGGKEVVINLDRWNTGDPGPEWAGHLDVYRNLVVNHEVGHFLGYSHMACPGPGDLLPVMATPYTTGLQGCVINGFPYDSTNKFISGPPEP